MTSELSNFTARLCERVSSKDRVTTVPDPENRTDNRNLCNSSLRNDEDFNSLALELFELQFAHNPPYRTVCEARRAKPNAVSHWAQIPAVPAAAFKELELSCLPPAQRTRAFHSSGTTEQGPSRHFHNAESLAVYEALLWAWFVPHVLQNSRFAACASQLAILTPSSAQAPCSSLVHMFETVRRRLGVPEAAFVGRVSPDGTWTLDFEAALARLTTESEPRTPETGLLLLGTAFAFVRLLDFLVERKLRFQLPLGSRVMETGGYKGRSRNLTKTELHALITRQLGVSPSHVICEYGMSELSSQAYDEISADALRTRHHASRRFHFPPWARAQIISPETGREVADGETGLIRVVDLANVFSVMAIQTEDLGIRRGDGFELIGRAELAEPRGCSLMTI